MSLSGDERGETSAVRRLTAFVLFLKKKLSTNFLDLVITLENLGARCFLEKKVNFVPCCYNNFCGNLPLQHTLYRSDIEVASF